MNANKLSRLFLVTLALSLLEACKPKPQATPAAVPVTVSSVKATTAPESSMYFASLQSRCSATLQPRIAGQVAKIFVKLGDQVEPGTTIIQLAHTRQQGRLQYSKISTPCPGIVGGILVDQGDYVNTSTELATITQNQPLDINIPIPTEQASRPRVGLPVELINHQNQVVGTTQIFFISPSVNPQFQTILVKSRLNNSKGQFRDGQSIGARVIWGQRPDVLIPVTALARLGGETFVFVAEKGQTQSVARARPVRLGEVEGNNYRVLEGLKPGERLVTSGILQLRDGTPIAPEPQDTRV